jgi:hypothetical protein
VRLDIRYSCVGALARTSSRRVARRQQCPESKFVAHFGERSGARNGARDAALALLIFAATVLYLTWLPRNLNAADESIHLYEAKRILAGEVLYRDVFEMITPGFMYLMALLFRLFGTDFATARIAQAVLHGLAALGLYYACRALDIRRGLAWPVPLAYLVICQTAWPMVSQHWLSTLLCIVLLLVCIDLRRDRAAAALRPGLVLGLLIGVQHPRGVIMSAGVFVWIIIDTLVQRRLRPDEPAAALPARLGWLIAGALIVIVPMSIAIVAHAGFQPAWRALVIFPLFDYRGSTHCPWAHVNYMSVWHASFTLVGVLRYLPAILPLTAARLLLLIVRRRDPLQAGRLSLLLVLCLVSMASIAYFPDFIHIAFIAPLFFVTIAESAEWLARALPVAAALPLRVAGWVAAVAVLIAAGHRLHDNAGRLAATFPVERDTAFGRIALDPLQAELYDKVSALMADVPSRELYCYPIIAHLYLMTDSNNPTPYGFLIPGYSGPDLIQHVVDILAAKQPPYIVALYLGPNDPIAQYIASHYEPLGEKPAAEQYIYRRKPAT